MGSFKRLQVRALFSPLYFTPLLAAWKAAIVVSKSLYWKLPKLSTANTYTKRWALDWILAQKTWLSLLTILINQIWLAVFWTLSKSHNLTHSGLRHLSAHTVDRLYCKRPIQCRESSKILTPTPSPPGECVPPRLWCGRRIHLLGGEGGGRSIFWKTPDTALYSTFVSTLWRILTEWKCLEGAGLYNSRGLKYIYWWLPYLFLI
jgi:hypothetical protein